MKVFLIGSILALIIAACGAPHAGTNLLGGGVGDDGKEHTLYKCQAKSNQGHIGNQSHLSNISLFVSVKNNHTFVQFIAFDLDDSIVPRINRKVETSAKTISAADIIDWKPATPTVLEFVFTDASLAQGLHLQIEHKSTSTPSRLRQGYATYVDGKPISIQADLECTLQ